MDNIKLELKYCERCGTLKLRRVDSATTYCRRCEGLLARYTLSRSAGNANVSAIPGLGVPGMLAGIPLPVSGAGRAQ